MPVAAPPAEALQLSESITLAIEEGATTVFDSDGCVPVHIIRPGVGKGRGKHLYEANMLSSNATQFQGWRMYVDHLAPEARRAAGGLPRSVRDLGGRIIESRWDPSVPADPARGYGQGAVVGRAKPVPFIRDLIENDPELIEASISASATGVRPVNHPGHGRVWMVEGIADRGSVDWVTEAGAGGRVAPLLESSYSTEEAVEMALLESMTDEEMRDLIASERPNLKVTLEGAKPPESLIDESEEDDMPITPEALQEALAANPDLLVTALQGSDALKPIIDARVEEALQAERELSEAERDAVINRRLELIDMATTARSLIEASKLPDSWQEGLVTRFQLREDHSPTVELDLVDEVDDSGSVTKPAKTRLREAVDEAINVERTKLAEVAPTRVRNQGPTRTTVEEGATPPEPAPAEKPYWKSFLEEASVDPDKAYSPTPTAAAA